MALTWKNVIDRNMWIGTSPAPNAHAAGVCLATDLRNDLSRNPFVYQLASAQIVNRYNAVTKGWQVAIGSFALAGTFGAGSFLVFVPSFALVGTLAAGSTTTKLKTATVLGATPPVNTLANRGGSGDYSYRIRVIGNTAGGSGKTEERWITGNTASTTPDIDVDVAFTFTPATGDRYEILGGRFMAINAGTLAAGSFKQFDVAINLAANKTQTNLPATIGTDTTGIVLDEQYVPYNRKPGEGFLIGAGTYDASNSKGCLIATASAAGTLTGQAAAGDAAVLANEYRNFQVRIVEDTAIPTAVGQRRIIASHTAGASPVYTLGAAWTVQPSATAKFVIENPNQLLVWTSATAVTYTYNYTDAAQNNGTNTIAADAWHVTYYGNRGGNMGAGAMAFGSWGIVPDVAKNARHSFVHTFRGGAGTLLDILDIAGAATGVWTNSGYDGAAPVWNTGSCGVSAPFDQEGRFAYINYYVASALNQMYRYDVKNRVLTAFVPTDFVQSGTAAVGNRLAALVAIDGTDKYTALLHELHVSSLCYELINTF